MPTVAHDPVGTARPCRASAASTSIIRAPAPIVTVPFGCIAIPFSRRTSTTRPVVVEYPA